jgi:hypothetical protein
MRKMKHMTTDQVNQSTEKETCLPGVTIEAAIGFAMIL